MGTSRFFLPCNWWRHRVPVVALAARRPFLRSGVGRILHSGQTMRDMVVQEMGLGLCWAFNIGFDGRRSAHRPAHVPFIRTPLQCK